MRISPTYALQGNIHNKATLAERVKTQSSGTYASPNLILFMIALPLAAILTRTDR